MVERLRWLDKQIAIQEEALVNARSMQTALVHNAHLERLTKEWCDLMDSLSEKEMAIYLGGKN
ncbi:MAG: hypothetical protein IJ880_01930 [Bacilli bacterium]|nr:hypothetical protein [Bacilli bacterium]